MVLGQPRRCAAQLSNGDTRPDGLRPSFPTLAKAQNGQTARAAGGSPTTASDRQQVCGQPLARPSPCRDIRRLPCGDESGRWMQAGRGLR